MVNNPNSVSEHGGGLTGIVNGSVDIAAVPAIVTRLLQNPEAAQYVMSAITDSAVSPEKFATIKVSGECVQDSLDAIADAVATLYVLGLKPVVVHGYGKALTSALSSAGIESKFDSDGDRITDEETMPYVEKISKYFGERLAKAIASRGANVQLMDYTSVFSVVPKASTGKDTGSRNGLIERVNTEAIISTLRRGIIPVISPMGHDEDGTLYNINGDTAASEVVRELRPHKYIMLTGTKGILGENGETISEITLNKDYGHLISGNIVSGGMLKKLDEAKGLLEGLGTEHSVQITTPQNLLTELFTKKGAGTYLTLGYELRHAKLSDLDWTVLKSVVEQSFGATLKPGYRESSANAEVVFENGMKGAMILRLDLKGVGPYMDIIAVPPPYQGNGLGKSLMLDGMQMRGIDELSWRSKPSRPATGFYLSLVQGGNGGFTVIKSADGIEYNAYWMGMPVDKALPAIKYMKKPSNFVSK